MTLIDTSCRDWEKRIVARQSLIAFPPLFPSEAETALEVFKALKIVDAPGSPTFGDACEQWVFDFVAAIFGAADPESGSRLIRDFFLLISKKNSKSTIAAGIMLTALIINWRLSAELLILAPTIEVADNSFKPAADMVRHDEELSALLHVQDHVRTITHRTTKAFLKVVAADADTVSGKKAAFVLVDELWGFGKKPRAAAMLREATGGLVSRPEGFVIYLSTQSDDPPEGVFKAKLDYFRAVRDGRIKDGKSLAVIYEFPEHMIEEESYLDPKNFYVTNPNLGRSVDAQWILDELTKDREAGPAELKVFLAKHLNIEIGLRQANKAWEGADFWEAAATSIPSLSEFLDRCEVVVVGIDGGGLDDLLGLTLLGREKGTGLWLSWSRAWAHKIVLSRRKDIAAKLEDLRKAGHLTIVDHPGQDVADVADLIIEVDGRGLLAEKSAIGVDPAGIVDIVDELVARGIVLDRIVAVSQGWKLNGAIKTTARKVAGGELKHEGSPLMAWCVGNARTEPKGNAITITKQVSGSAKIDPLMSLFNAVSLMSLNPEAGNGRSVYSADRGILFFG